MARRDFVLGIAVLLSLSAICFASESTAPPVAPEQWLAAPDHADFKVDSRVLKPRLTFQQRYLVEARAAIDGSVARGRNLLAWLIVETPSGNVEWESVINEHIATADLDKSSLVEIISAFYARAGKYKAAFAIWDRDADKLNLRHFDIVVEHPKNDPLPQYGNAAPEIEFTDKPPAMAQDFRHTNQSPDLKVEPFWPLAHGGESLPIANASPLMIDIVVDFSDTGEPVDFSYKKFKQPPQLLHIQTATAIASALGELKPQAGCVRFSAYDSELNEIVFWRKAVADIDWTSVRKEREKKADQISIQALTTRKHQPAFIRNLLERTAKPEAGCGGPEDAPTHFVILVSQGFQFASGAERVNLDSREMPNTKVFYIHDQPPKQIEYTFSGRPIWGRDPVVFDELPRMLKPLHATQFDVDSPLAFREALAQIVRKTLKP